MTEEELRRLRVSADQVALAALFSLQSQAVRELALLLPAWQRAECLKGLAAKLSAMQEDQALLVFEEMPPALSDLWAGELQDAFARRTQELQSHLSGLTEP